MVEDEEDEFQAKKEKLKRIQFHIPAGILRGSLEMHQQGIFFLLTLIFILE